MKNPGKEKLPRQLSWLADPGYLPSLDEVRQAQSTDEGNLAIRQHFYRSPKLGRERFEIWTQEYIKALSGHIVETLTETESMGGTILEIGAGEGRLAAMLRRQMKASKIGSRVVATDIEPPPKTTFSVKAMRHDTALERYRPVVAIASWMPVYEEWSWQMRATPELEEYILIGSPSLCGNASTWNGYSSPQIGEFRMVDLEELDILKEGQFSHPGHDHHSITRSFRRVSDAQAAGVA